MSTQTIPRRAGRVALAVAFVAVAATVSGSATATPRGTSSGAGHGSHASTQAASTMSADAEFVAMMIPHHHQALVMSTMAPEQAGSDRLKRLASRIDVEQGLEIGMMQGWQEWNGLAVTDAEQAYQHMLGMPMILEQMGMATPAELDQLADASGTDFDVLYLELMIEHHEGAIDMLVDVIINGEDFIIQQWATDMLTTQTVQIDQMQAMLEDLQ